MVPLETMNDSSLISGFLSNEGATLALIFDCLKDATASGDDSETVGGARELETVGMRGPTKTLVIKRARRSTIGVVSSYS